MFCIEDNVQVLSYKKNIKKGKVLTWRKGTDTICEV